ncbi:stage VI sporulation protein F [Caldalkalibacillus thermarum TA2.A1]|uniref:Stage VI sporulation protein F n=1 Tax=Caldalkalibacillus thermarum (strain TA2.A1) TaxID=986075 RepID=A0A8X8L9I4_CALTT|nr:stage VI sporulation protein F [Caldalkalibacillus thermarum]QZT32634.1 stage VI sporulation protein F [Caldalkalibacillus thermarum TA2.A1]GGK18936.1 hypothetical protein GCM10010965_09920 [Caldalkalibacillus thermarum]
MAKRKDSNNFFDQVEKKTNVSEKDLKALASKVNPEDLQNEKKVRELIAQVAALAGIPVSKEKEDQIVHFLVTHQPNMEEMQAMLRMFLAPKK